MIERGQARFDGSGNKSPYSLRVTMIVRREETLGGSSTATQTRS
jgi:hypothetical protein